MGGKWTYASLKLRVRITFQLLTFSLLSDIVSSNQRSYKLQDIKHEMEKDEAILKSFNDVVL